MSIIYDPIVDVFFNDSRLQPTCSPYEMIPPIS